MGAFVQGLEHTADNPSLGRKPVRQSGSNHVSVIERSDDGIGELFGIAIDRACVHGAGHAAKQTIPLRIIDWYKIADIYRRHSTGDTLRYAGVHPGGEHPAKA